jgi:hypothetical protein
MSDREILSQIPPARRRARLARLAHPAAMKARYDRSGRQLHVTLTNGTTLIVPVDLISSLRRAEETDLAAVRVGVAGLGLRWDDLDEDLSVEGLARIALGSRMLLRAAGAAGGASRSPAKMQAARRNGLKGGRPRKMASRGFVANRG